MEKGEIPPTAPLALIQKSCIRKALPGRDQPQIQALLLHKQGVSATRNASAWPQRVSASKNGWMLPHREHHGTVLLWMEMTRT